MTKKTVKPPVMTPGPPPGAPGVNRVVVLELDEGWSYDPKRRMFVSPDGEHVRLPSDALPPGARLQPVVHASAHRARAIAPALERYVHIVVPPDADPARIVETAKAWTFVASAQPGPVPVPPTAPKSTRR